MSKLKSWQVPPGLAELVRDVPQEVNVSLLAQWEGGTGGDVASGYGVRLSAPAFGRRDSFSATVVLRPNLDVSSVQAIFRSRGGREFPFDADLLAYHDIDAKQVIDALCVDAPYDGVFALVDRICRGMLDGGVDGLELSRDGIKKVPQSVVRSFFPVIQRSRAQEAKRGYVVGSVSRRVAVQELIRAGYDSDVASRLVRTWEGLRLAREELRWKWV
jgi:hypothetical protein